MRATMTTETGDRSRRRHGRRGALALIGAAGLLAGCVTSRTSGGTQGPENPSAGVTSGTFGTKPNTNCVGVDMAVSSEKIALLTEIATSFNADKSAQIGGRCIQVRPYSKSSGSAATALTQGWKDVTVNGPQPVVWSPAASAWAGIVNQRTGTTIAPAGRSFMRTPLVIAMPKPMADALGYPAKSIGFADIVKLAKDDQGWAAHGHPEWGPFRLGKTNPNYSTSGFNFTIAQYYAATGKTRDLTTEDLARPDVEQFAKDVESAVVHYGDITLTFLNNWFRADARGTALTYASAVAVEEKSVIDYNSGNPDGVLDPGETPRVPKVPLVAIYPTEGTLFSDSPFIVLDAPWVTPEQRQAAELFRTFALTPDVQAKVLKFGFRPGNPDVPVGSPIEAKFGVDAAKPDATLDVPQPQVLTGILDRWASNRKTARVLLVIDVSGSMGDPADGSGGDTKLELAKRAAASALDQFQPGDQVGLRIFSTGLAKDPNITSIDLVPVAPMQEGQPGKIRSAIENLVPQHGTPLYLAAAESYTAMADKYDPAAINAVVLLTDGVNDDGNASDDNQQLAGLIDEVRVGSEGANTRPVRLFTIAYGKDADKPTLKRIAEASTGAAYDASNPNTIDQVFAAVVSNF